MWTIEAIESPPAGQPQEVLVSALGEIWPRLDVYLPWWGHEGFSKPGDYAGTTLARTTFHVANRTVTQVHSQFASSAARDSKQKITRFLHWVNVELIRVLNRGQTQHNKPVNIGKDHSKVEPSTIFEEKFVDRQRARSRVGTGETFSPRSRRHRCEAGRGRLGRARARSGRVGRNARRAEPGPPAAEPASFRSTQRLLASHTQPNIIKLQQPIAIAAAL